MWNILSTIAIVPLGIAIQPLHRIVHNCCKYPSVEWEHLEETPMFDSNTNQFWIFHVSFFHIFSPWFLLNSRVIFTRRPPGVDQPGLSDRLREPSAAAAVVGAARDRLARAAVQTGRFGDQFFLLVFVVECPNCVFFR